jgi:hypothetical protein
MLISGAAERSPAKARRQTTRGARRDDRKLLFVGSQRHVDPAHLRVLYQIG